MYKGGGVGKGGGDRERERAREREGESSWESRTAHKSNVLILPMGVQYDFKQICLN